nr:hypothetical protein [Tanacetum cinerariifolium]
KVPRHLARAGAQARIRPDGRTVGTAAGAGAQVFPRLHHVLLGGHVQGKRHPQRPAHNGQGVCGDYE